MSHILRISAYVLVAIVIFFAASVVGGFAPNHFGEHEVELESPRRELETETSFQE